LLREVSVYFENKIAALLGKRLAYTYYPDSTGFIKNTRNAIRCDLVIGIGQGTDLLQTTNPYYRTSYMLVTKKDSDIAGVDSLADPKLKSKRLGMTAVHRRRPSCLDKAKSYPLVVDSRFSSPEEQMIKDLESGTIDGAILWGPMGSYFVKNLKSFLSQTLLVKKQTDRK
jgi:hypothetical protein